MLIPNQFFDIKIIKTNIEHYRSLGYNVQLKDIITVPTEHLTKGSHQEVQVECDYCGKKFPRIYKSWYWHQDSQRDRRRDEHFKSKGWKVLRIKSGHKLPTEEQLFEAIDKLINTNRKYTEIKLDDWKEGKVTA